MKIIIPHLRFDETSCKNPSGLFLRHSRRPFIFMLSIWYAIPYRWWDMAGVIVTFPAVLHDGCLLPFFQCLRELGFEDKAIHNTERDTLNVRRHLS